MKDRVITCIQCENSFIFTRSEQERFRARGFDEPKRCPECRKKKSRGVEMPEAWKDKGKQKKHNWQRHDAESDEL
jgi:hypothetical protein